ncbi:MAG: rhomboid family intramembrane serine protease [Chloroflexi bacterium]|nr:rhomboid family intramembrane serine protease [Chloroflexota bacterium]
MIPLRDANPTRRLPVVTLALIAACVGVFLYEIAIQASGGDAALSRLFDTWGAVPSRISAALQGEGDAWQAARGVFGSLFLHGGWIHLIGNMLFLWIFGNNVEDRLGRLPFLLFYLAGGVAATLAQVWMDPASTTPLVGASGAIAATLGAYIVVYPRARILTLIFLGFFYQLLEIPAVLVLGFWFLLQLVDGAASLGATSAQGGVAFFAHIGGFVAGAIVGLLIRGLPGGGRPAYRDRPA